MIVGKYTLHNEEKVMRVLEGGTKADGTKLNGIKKADGTFVESELLAEYDKLGGLITNESGSTVKTGSFYDFQAKCARKEPKVELVFRINGEVVSVAEGEQKPDIVRAAEILEAAKKTRKPRKA